MTLFLLSLALIGSIMLIMAVGVIFSGRCLRGSCGGPAVLDGDGEPVTCATCPNRERLRAEAGIQPSVLHVVREESS
jgi:hypothetical protein